MTKFISLLIFLSCNPLFSQIFIRTLVPTDKCTTAPVACNSKELFQVEGSFSGVAITPSSLYEDQYLGFIASSDSVDLFLTTDASQGSRKSSVIGPGCSGPILSSNDFEYDCNHELRNLIPGEVYYILVSDLGSEKSARYFIYDNLFPGQKTEITGPSNLCGSVIETFSIPSPSASQYEYVWDTLSWANPAGRVEINGRSLKVGERFIAGSTIFVKSKVEAFNLYARDLNDCISNFNYTKQIFAYDQALPVVYKNICNFDTFYNCGVRYRGIDFADNQFYLTCTSTDSLDCTRTQVTFYSKTDYFDYVLIDTTLSPGQSIQITDDYGLVGTYSGCGSYTALRRKLNSNCSQTVGIILNQVKAIRDSIRLYSNSFSYFITPKGGLPPYSFKWLNSAGVTVSTSQDLINTPFGKYKLVVKDAAGCENIIEDFELNEPIVNSNNCSTNPILSDDCDSACVFINANNFLKKEFNNYELTPDGNITDWCNTIENNGYLGFIAADTICSFQLTTRFCQSGSGMQMAIHGPSCLGLTLPGCVTDIKINDSKILTAHPLQVGAIYYFVVDGVAGSICKFQIDSISGAARPYTPALSVNDFSSEELQAFPNPASTNISVVNNTGTTIEFSCFDVLGKKHKTTILDSSNSSVDVSDLLSGFYIVEMKSGLKVCRKSWVIIR
jgi:hypothetical protein